ncbi:MAG: SCO family protein [Candidatus Nitricoxidivorans perseverans]|uniref:SCO family protein n=1 Tax=Candidatus Nitricoxidivorans perseverans TaxID=2975601 RepID=A0AA49FLB1_9PROT|nr:MAG: SCO family protein [Candidatus Nitricoxidivorans perseverans]
MTSLPLRAATLVAAAFAVLPASTSAETAPAPKVTARPLGSVVNTSLTVLDEKEAVKLSQGVIGQPVGDHVLLDRQGRPTPLSRYRGKPLLVSFIYTACFQVCPTTTRNLQKAVEGTVAMLGADRFNIVSIGFNQPFDSPEAMKSFAKQYGIYLPNWEFLSPAPAIVNDLTRNFGFSYIATPAGFDHINQVTIVDAEGKIFRQVYGESFTAEALAEPLKAMITGASIPPDVNMLGEVLDRIRILCSIYDPVTGKYRTNYAIYFEIAGLLTFIIWLAWYFWQDRRSRKPRSG